MGENRVGLSCQELDSKIASILETSTLEITDMEVLEQYNENI